MTETTKYGLTSWDDEEFSVGGSGRKDEFMKLTPGNNIIRCLTRPARYLVHTFKEEGMTGFGDKIMCTTTADCPLCLAKNPAKRRWYVGVIDRDGQRYKILDIGGAIFKDVQQLSREPDYGEPIRYDINIKVNKQGGATGYYTVIPKPPQPLSAADVEIKNQIALDDLQRRCTPPSVEKVLEKMAYSRSKNVKSGAPTERRSNTSHASMEDESMEFPAV